MKQRPFSERDARLASQ